MHVCCGHWSVGVMSLASFRLECGYLLGHCVLHVIPGAQHQVTGPRSAYGYGCAWMRVGNLLADILAK